MAKIVGGVPFWERWTIASHAAKVRAADRVVAAARLEHNKYVSTHICEPGSCAVADALRDFDRAGGG